MPQDTSLPQKSIKQSNFVKQIVLVALTSVIFGSVGFFLVSKATNKKTSTPNVSVPPEIQNGFPLGDYVGCNVFPRSSANIPPSTNTIIGKSTVVCETDGIKQSIIEVTDKDGFDTAKNSIYRIWKETEGYKALLVDQNGAGSGEGIGKIILLKDQSYFLQSCFYYIPENFSGSFSQALSENELVIVKESELSIQKPECTNFTLVSKIN